MKEPSIMHTSNSTGSSNDCRAQCAGEGKKNWSTYLHCAVGILTKLLFLLISETVHNPTADVLNEF